MIKDEITYKIILNTLGLGIATISAYFGMQMEAVVMYTILLSLDFISGLMASYKVGDDITSHKIIAGVYTKVSMLFLLLGTGAFAKMIGVNAEYTVMFFTGFMVILGLGELYSLTANVHCIKTGERHKEQIVITDYLLKYIKNWVDKALKE